MRVPGITRRLAGLEALLLTLIFITTACQSESNPSEPNPTLQSALATHAVISLDTLRLGPVGAKGSLTARLYDANENEVTGQMAKWWANSSTRLRLSSQICTFPCTVDVTSMAVGTVRVIAYWYGGPLSALRDTALVGAAWSPPHRCPPARRGVEHRYSLTGPRSAACGWVVTGLCQLSDR